MKSVKIEIDSGESENLLEILGNMMENQEIEIRFCKTEKEGKRVVELSLGKEGEREDLISAYKSADEAEMHKYNIEGFPKDKNSISKPLNSIINPTKNYTMCLVCDKSFMKDKLDKSEIAKVCERCKKMISHFAKLIIDNKIEGCTIKRKEIKLLNRLHNIEDKLGLLLPMEEIYKESGLSNKETDDLLETLRRKGLIIKPKDEFFSISH